MQVKGSLLSVRSTPDEGRWIRQRGMDIRQGEPLIAARTRLSAGCLSNLAQQGIQEVETFKTPTIGILTTGDEVCSLDVPRPNHQIFNSNQTLLKALLQKTEARLGRCLHAPDSPQIIEESLKDLSKNHDLILTTGGASVGERDHLIDVLRSSGDVHFWKVKMRPGKPVFAGQVENTPSSWSARESREYFRELSPFRATNDRCHHRRGISPVRLDLGSLSNRRSSTSSAPRFPKSVLGVAIKYERAALQIGVRSDLGPRKRPLNNRPSHRDSKYR